MGSIKEKKQKYGKQVRMRDAEAIKTQKNVNPQRSKLRGMEAE